MSALPGWCVPPCTRPERQDDDGTSITPATAAIEVAGGVDTHLDTHTAAVIDLVGRVLGTEQFPTTRPVTLRCWPGCVGSGGWCRVGVEGTGAYGAGLARLLRDRGVTVIEVDRPNRKTRRFQGKSDPIDAIAAAKTALAGERTGTPKQRDGRIEALRNLRVARRSAVAQRADTQRQIKALIVTAPDDLRDRLRGLSVKELIATCANLRPDRADAATPATAAKIALRSWPAATSTSPPRSPTWTNSSTPWWPPSTPPARRSTASAPTSPANSWSPPAKTPTGSLRSRLRHALRRRADPRLLRQDHRHRLNRGGDRQANAALYRVVIVRLRWDPRTRAYVERRTAEGLSKKEIIRCLKRYVARELYQIITVKRS